jgi:hypothetical protein
VATTTIPDNLRSEVETLWDFHQMHHKPRRAEVGVGLGSHDPTVPMVAVDLFTRNMFPYVVFTGANAPTTIERYPRGEAVHYGEYAVEHGIPSEAILLEKRSTTTAENILFTRQLLAEHHRDPRSVLLMSRPYQQRRAYAICQKLWPEADVICASTSLPLDDYVGVIGDADRVINMMVGDIQRLDLDVHLGVSLPQDVPPTVAAAYDRLIAAGFVARLIR